MKSFDPRNLSHQDAAVLAAVAAHNAPCSGNAMWIQLVLRTERLKTRQGWLYALSAWLLGWPVHMPTSLRNHQRLTKLAALCLLDVTYQEHRCIEAIGYGVPETYLHPYYTLSDRGRRALDRYHQRYPQPADQTKNTRPLYLATA